MVHIVCPSDETSGLWLGKRSPGPISNLPDAPLARHMASSSLWGGVPLAQQPIFPRNERIHHQTHYGTNTYTSVSGKPRRCRNSHVLWRRSHPRCTPCCAKSPLRRYRSHRVLWSVLMCLSYTYMDTIWCWWGGKAAVRVWILWPDRSHIANESPEHLSGGPRRFGSSWDLRWSFGDWTHFKRIVNSPRAWLYQSERSILVSTHFPLPNLNTRLTKVLHKRTPVE